MDSLRSYLSKHSRGTSRSSSTGNTRGTSTDRIVSVKAYGDSYKAENVGSQGQVSNLGLHGA